MSESSPIASGVAPHRATETRGPAPWREDLERSLRAGDNASVVLEAPDFTPEALLDPTNPEISEEWSPAVFWHTHHPTFGDETLVGLGRFAEVESPWGDTEAIETFGRNLLAQMKLFGPGASVYQPRVFSAIGFAASKHPANSDQAADAASSLGWGCLPRLTYVKQRAPGTPRVAAWYCLTLCPSDLPKLDSLLQRLGSLSRRMRQSAMRPGAPIGQPVQVTGTSVREWNEWLASAIQHIRERQLDKVVAARFTRLTFARPPSAAHTLLSLSVDHRDSTRFAFFRGRSVFLGATPERLITKRNSFVETAALAGTVWRQPGSEVTNMAEQFGRKEYTEHSPVLDTILSILTPLCAELSSDASPGLCAQRDVFHLRTAVRGTLRSPIHVLSLVRRLHPTPAVAGRPTAAALTWIGEHETFDRGYYAGPIGWFDGHGDGQFDVALRSGIIRDNHLTLFGGAGIVEGSEPQREFDETTQKMQVLLGSVCHALDGSSATSG